MAPVPPPPSWASGGSTGGTGWPDETGGSWGTGTGGTGGTTGGMGGTSSASDGGDASGGTGGMGGAGGTFPSLDGGWSSSVGGSGGSGGSGGTGGSAGTGGSGGTGGSAGTGGMTTGGSGGGFLETDAGMPSNYVIPTGPPPSDKCANAPEIDLSSPRINLPVNLTSATADLASTCGGSGADVFYKFRLSKPSIVYADSFGASWNTIVYFSRSCTSAVMPPGNPQACSDDSCGTGQSQAVAYLPSGEYYLVIAGAGAAKGEATIHFEQAIAGKGGATPLPSGTSTLTGMLKGTGALFKCEAGGNDYSYYWATCHGFTPAKITAGTCENTMFDSLMTLHTPRNGITICADDGCGLQSKLEMNLPAGAGLNVLSVDSSSPVHNGPYTLTVTRP